MKKKLQFLFSLVVLMLVASTAKAQIYLETDMTSKFSKLTEVASWTGATGYTATNFCPMVEVGGGIGQKQVCEKYQDTCENTGDVFYATVTGLAPGTYKIELYGGAAYTFGRGFPSTAFSEGTWEAGQKIEPSEEVSTGVVLYAESEDKTYGGEIPIYYATDFPEGAATVTLSGIVVGESGSIKIGLSKTSTSTNWHVIQLKSVIATVDADAALAAAVADANAVKESDVPASIYSALQEAVSEYNKTYETAAEYEVAIKAINDAVAAAQPFVVAKPKLDAMKALVDATNFYTDEAYNTYYGQWAEKFADGTLTNAEAAALQDPTKGTGWHAAITVDNFLLSAWDTYPDFPSGVPYYINTWSVEGDNDGSNFRVPFFEYWTGDDNSLGAKTLTGEVTGLDPGNYAVEAWVRVRLKNNVTDAPTGITFSANGGEAVNVSDGAQVGTSQFYIKNVRVPATVDEEGKLTAQFIVADDNNISWLSFKDVKYITAAEAAQKEMDENYAAAQAAIQDGNYYEISTKVGETTYYLKMNDANTGAILTADEAEATAFQFTAQKAASNYLYENGWNLGVQFTNPNTTNGKGDGAPKNEGFIRRDGKNNRDTWERQVFFLNADGGYAVRSTNAAGSSWCANTFWDVVDAEATPAVAGHGSAISYVWNLTDVTAKATLAAAQKVVDAKEGVGDALFFIPEEAYNTYAGAVSAAAEIINNPESTPEQVAQALADLNAATATYEAAEVSKPEAGKAYFVANATATGNLNVAAGKVTVASGAWVYFTEVEGGYAISNEKGEYIFKTTGNTWTLSSTENLAEAYVLTVVPVAGGYTLKGANGLIGLDSTDEGSACYANKAQSNNGLWTISEGPVFADLTPAMYHVWNGVGTEAQQTEETPGCEFALFKKASNIYGNSSVKAAQYADLSEWDYLTIAAVDGTPRLLLNRPTDDSQDYVNIPNNEEQAAKYIKSSEDGVFVYDLAAIKADYGFVQLNAIKGFNFAETTTQVMKLSTKAPFAPTWYTITPAEGLENGTVSSTWTKAVEGAPVPVTATPDEGFELEAISYTAEGSEAPVTVEGTTFTMPAANVTVSATFVKAPEYAYTDLTADMFFEWTSPEADAEEVGAGGCAYVLDEATGLPYGNGSVVETQYADLSDFTSLTLTLVGEGTPRLLFNTVGATDPKTYLEINAEGTYARKQAIEGGSKWIIDLAKITEDKGFAHLNCIKANGWGNNITVSEMELAMLVETPEIALNSPIFNFEEGTQAEPNIQPAGSKLTINWSAENLEENLVTEDAVQVKMTVMVSGDLPENMMTMGSTTAHRVLGETFYVGLGEQDFPVELKPGYVYQNIAVMAAELVLPGDEETPEVSLATYAGAPVQLHWVGIAAEEEEDPDLIEIAQDQGKDLDDFTRTDLVEGDDYNTYTAQGGLNVAFKMFDIDVAGCDYVTVKFAEPAPKGWYLAFWGKNDTHSVAVPEGATEFIYNWSTYEEYPSAVENDILPQICMLTLFDQVTYPLEAKVAGVYKHKVAAADEKTIEIAVERMVGQGYGAQTETIDFAEAAEFLGVDAVTNDMLRVVTPADALDANYAPYDGWFNKDGYAQTWGANAFVCVKLWDQNDNGAYSICDMGGASGAENPQVGDKVTVHWAAVANDKTVFFNINVTFVEAQAPEIAISENVIKAEVTYDVADAQYTEKVVTLSDEDVAAILTELGLSSLDEATVYGYNPSTEELVAAYAGYDGWRAANGDFAYHTGNAEVPACVKYTDGQNYLCYNIAGLSTQSIKTYWAIANAEKAVLVEITFNYEDVVGIDGIAGSKAKTEGRKYIEDGKVYIFRNGKKVLVSGIQTK